MARISAEVAGGANAIALLDTVARSEIDAWTLANSDDGYNVLVGSHGPTRKSCGGEFAPALLTFPSYETHPNVLNRALDSTAAGRYQLLHRWFAPYAKELNLPDFSPLSQDMIAIQQIRERGALELIQHGQFAMAIAACSNIWASLPGNSYGQHENSLASLAEIYKACGGQIAVG
ncbi:lysozyme [Pandoraea anapnoica]|uniref:Lysozyme n=1 Tax=Pandoraea anapnoica TaxID=2508301 RepID=A0A5E5A455_9BURK|nr:glycoside hydrolase family 104 protein [Pandoraea anapnoica]VVE67857.1 lysozyme [Pandoraea anapnoica]